MAKPKNKTESHTSIPSGWDPEQAEVVKNLSLPAFKLEENVTRYFKITTPMKISALRDGKDDANDKRPKAEQKKTREPATVVDAVDLKTGEVGVLICTAVIKSSLTENYPDDGYVGRAFKITRHEKMQGKNYSKYSVVEIALPE